MIYEGERESITSTRAEVLKGKHLVVDAVGRGVDPVAFAVLFYVCFVRLDSPARIQAIGLLLYKRSLIEENGEKSNFSICKHTNLAID